MSDMTHARAARCLLLAASASGALLASPALAQPAPSSNTIGEVVVTAQRREERAQDVPIVITAFSAEQLQRQNVTEPQDLYGSVPSLVSGTQGQATRDVQSYSIRGQSTGFLASPGVALYMNEVPLPAAITLNLQGSPGTFLDLENVQVLSGPQGTLFGRNTTGGAVLFVPRKPSNDFGGYIEGTAGNYDLTGVEGAVNIPIVQDKLLVRVAGAYQDRRGFTRDLVWNKWRDDTHWYTGRIGVTFRPNDRLENYLMAYGTKSSNNGSGNIHGGWNLDLLKAIGFCYEGPSIPGAIASCDVYRAQTALQEQIGPRQMRGNVDGFSKIESWGLINTTTYNLTDNLKIRNIVSLQKLKDNYATDQDGTPLQQYELNQNAREPDFPIAGLAEFGLPLGGVYSNSVRDFDLPRDYLKQVTEELQLQGTLLDNHLTFATGVFFYDSSPAGAQGSQAVNFCPAAFTGLCMPGSARMAVTNKSKAAYAQATLDLGAFTPALDKLRLTAGYRYTADRIEGFNQGWNIDAAAGTATCLIGATPTTLPASEVNRCGFGATLKSEAPTWTLGLDYRPLPDLLLYAKASRGYKAGGFNAEAVRAETQTFAPEKLTTYETGFKSDWRIAEMPLRFNLAYYYSDYKNIQRPGGDFNPVTGAAGAAILAATARIQGVEGELSFRPLPSVELGTTVSYTDAKYKDFHTTAFAPTEACNGLVLPGDTADFSCAPFQFVTPWIYSLHASVDLPVPDRFGRVSLYVAYNHVSSQYTAPAPFEPGARVAGYGLLNASLTWNDVAHSGVDAIIFGNNLTDELFRVSNSNTFNTLFANSSLYGEPRTYGLKLRYRFGER